MGKNKNLVIYHKVDYDGIFSCLIAKKALENKGLEVETLGYNYGDPLPDIPHLLGRYATITLVDISLPAPQMIKLRDSYRVTWIDHHVTALEESGREGYQNIPGLRIDGTAACELTWTYFNQGTLNTQAPTIIQLAGAYDVWNKDRFNWDNDVLPLQYGLKGRYGVNLKKIEADWDLLVDEESYLDVVEEGQVILEFLRKQWKGWMSNSAFEVKVAGKYKGIAILSPMFSSNSFESVMDKYDIYVVVSPKEDGTKFGVGMYREPDRLPEFSCGQYMKQGFGGGGHDAAAGGQLTKEQFQKLIFGKEI